MSNNDILKIAKVRPNGSIIINDDVRCDGDDFAGIDIHIPTACFTHIHDDHIRALPDAIAQCSNVLVTQLTKELANVMFRNTGNDATWLNDRSNFIGMEFGEKNNKKINGCEISFIKCNHILGSAQLLVRAPNFTVLYSSDFSVPGTEIVKDVDYLILDSTHGAFSRNQKFEPPSAAHKLTIDKAKEIIEYRNKPLIIRAHRGTLQKVMSWLRPEIDEHIPFFANSVEKNIASIYSRHGFECGEIKNEEEWEKYYLKNHPFVRFLAIGTNPLECELIYPPVPSIRIGSSTSSTLTNVNDMFTVNLKEHATIDDVIIYTKQMNPKYVIIDNSSRVANPDNAKSLFNEIQKIKPTLLSPEFHPNEIKS